MKFDCQESFEGFLKVLGGAFFNKVLSTRECESRLADAVISSSDIKNKSDLFSKCYDILSNNFTTEDSEIIEVLNIYRKILKSKNEIDYRLNQDDLIKLFLSNNGFDIMNPEKLEFCNLTIGNDFAFNLAYRLFSKLSEMNALFSVEICQSLNEINDLKFLSFLEKFGIEYRYIKFDCRNEKSCLMVKKITSQIDILNEIGDFYGDCDNGKNFILSQDADIFFYEDEKKSTKNLVMFSDFLTLFSSETLNFAKSCRGFIAKYSDIFFNIGEIFTIKKIDEIINQYDLFSYKDFVDIFAKNQSTDDKLKEFLDIIANFEVLDIGDCLTKSAEFFNVDDGHIFKANDIEDFIFLFNKKYQIYRSKNLFQYLKSYILNLITINTFTFSAKYIDVDKIIYIGDDLKVIDFIIKNKLCKTFLVLCENKFTEILLQNNYSFAENKCNLKVGKTENRVKLSNELYKECSLQKDFLLKLVSPFSYKKLSTYLENKYLFFAKYILGVKNEKAGYIEKVEHGNAVHLCFKYIIDLYQNNKEIVLDNNSIIKYIQTNINSNLFNKLSQIKLASNMTNIVNFCRELFAENSTSEFIAEGEFKCKINVKNYEIELYAKPDLIIKNENNKYSVIDFKTGNSDMQNKTIKKELEMISPQMLFYAFVLQKSIAKNVSNISYCYVGGDSISTSSYFDFFEENKLQNYIDEFEVFLVKILEEIIECDFERIVNDNSKIQYEDIFYLRKKSN